MKRISKSDFEYSAEFAQAYTEYNFGESYQFFVDSLLEHHDLKSGSLVDLCCGTGEITSLLKHQLPNLTITGYDSSPGMIAQALKNGANVKYICDNIENINDKFDIIISNNAYHHFDDIDKFWNTVSRLSNPTSKIFVSDIVRPTIEDDVERIVSEVLGSNTEIGYVFSLSLKASYTKDELQEHIKGNFNLKIIQTPIEGLEIFCIHN
jgi:2-polyprenyl-3-methyl-5-hydroxy-6-metoxy-1,4-benzoquinol methylase